MEDAALWLLIIVSATLTVFLILLSIGIWYIIKILQKANNVADTVESAASAVKKGAKAMPIAGAFSKFMKKEEEDE